MIHTVLAARSDFSVGESILDAKRLVAAAKAAGQTAVALTDTMSVTAMVNFTNAAKKEGIKPIIGTRLRLVDDPTWRPEKGQKKKDMPRDYFLTVYARTEAGMKAIYRLLTLGNSDERFYYVPKLGWQDLYDELTDDLIVVTGDGPSILEHPDSLDILTEIHNRTPHLYAPLIPIDTPYYGRLNELALLAARNGAAQLVVVRPALYDREEADAQEIMAAVASNTKLADPWFRSRFNRDMHVMGVQEMVGEIKKAAAHLEKRGYPGTGKMFSVALSNTEDLVNAVTYQWEKQPVSLPKMAPDEFKAVVDECKKGWTERFTRPVFGHQPSKEDLERIYKPRLAYELSILKKLDFSGYFLLVQDIVRFSKSNDILVGPGRGSVGGSLVAYLMGITDCDPIRFGLLFERFINPSRIDLPDADLDFMSTRRHEVFEYITNHYGASRVAGVNNYGSLQAASAIRDVGKCFGLSERDLSVSKLAPKKHGANLPLKEAVAEVPEIEVFSKANEVVWPFMLRLEGMTRNFGQHAAGFVVAGCDVVERGVIERRKEGSVICWDKRIVEDQGLVKVDILGLSTLDLIHEAMKHIAERHGRAPDLMGIPLDDENVLGRFARGETTGIFQFESGGMRRLLKDLGSTGEITFEDITAATALYRPGPMESGMMDSFAKRKQGYEPIDYDHPKIEPILEDTFGVIVYQEQVMKIAQEIAGYSGAEADKLRKIMGKKLPEEMAKERDKFVQGCVATNQCDPDWAGHLFDKIEGFAGYGFNRSHSVEYTLISYQSMWLKTYYPVEFYAAALTIMDTDKLEAILRDAKANGVSVEPPDINNSSQRFEILTDTRLAIPFQRLLGLSTKTADAILEARKGGPFKDKADFLARVEKRRCNKRAQDVLDRAGAFARIEPGQVPAVDPSRLKDQIELLPGLIIDTVPVNRDLDRSKIAKDRIAEVIDDYRAAHGPAATQVDGMPVKPHFGKEARIMLISDAPGGEEDGNGIMGLAKSQTAVADAMYEAGLDWKDVYWTALVKRPKRGKTLSPEEIKLYRPYLEREIDILKPPVIVMLGTSTVRTFLSDFKGKASDQAGKVVYSQDHDANLVVAFNPGEIWHDPEKQQNMNAALQAAADLLA